MGYGSDGGSKLFKILDDPQVGSLKTKNLKGQQTATSKIKSLLFSIEKSNLEFDLCIVGPPLKQYLF